MRPNLNDKHFSRAVEALKINSVGPQTPAPTFFDVPLAGPLLGAHDPGPRTLRYCQLGRCYEIVK